MFNEVAREAARYCCQYDMEKEFLLWYPVSAPLDVVLQEVGCLSFFSLLSLSLPLMKSRQGR